MIYSTAASLPMAFFVGLNLAVGVAAFRKKRSSEKTDVAKDPWASLPPLAFSDFEHQDLLAYEEEVNPLSEAKIYAIYGKRRDAQAILDAGVREGRITTQDVVGFWAGRDAEEGDSPRQEKARTH